MKSVKWGLLLTGSVACVSLLLGACNSSSFSGGSSTGSKPDAAAPGATPTLGPDGKPIADPNAGFDSGGAGGAGTPTPGAVPPPVPGKAGEPPGTITIPPPPPPAPEEPPKKPNDCVQIPNGKFVRFPPAFKACVEQGKIFSFVTNQCTNVSSNTSFTCNFTEMIPASRRVLKADADLNSVFGGQTVLQTNAKKAADSAAAFMTAKGINYGSDAVMVACAEKQDGNMVMAQWFVASTGGVATDVCTESSVIPEVYTGCYRWWTDLSQKPPDATTQEQHKVYVEACLTAP